MGQQYEYQIPVSWFDAPEPTRVEGDERFALVDVLGELDGSPEEGLRQLLGVEGGIYDEPGNAPLPPEVLAKLNKLLKEDPVWRQEAEDLWLEAHWKSKPPEQDGMAADKARREGNLKVEEKIMADVKKVGALDGLLQVGEFTSVDGHLIPTELLKGAELVPANEENMLFDLPEEATPADSEAKEAAKPGDSEMRNAGE